MGKNTYIIDIETDNLCDLSNKLLKKFPSIVWGSGDEITPNSFWIRWPIKYIRILYSSDFNDYRLYHGYHYSNTLNIRDGFLFNKDKERPIRLIPLREFIENEKE